MYIYIYIYIYIYMYYTCILYYVGLLNNETVYLKCYYSYIGIIGIPTRCHDKYIMYI